MKLHTTVRGTRAACPRLNRAARRAPAWLALALACFAAAISARAESVASTNRFLFIVDMSAGMKPLDAAVRETAFDLVFSGARGHMTNGDTFGLWVVNDRNDTSFGIDVWKARHGVETGAKAAMHVREHSYRGQARLDLAMADALRVVKNVGDLTIVLISNGETPLSGTPFDEAINAKYREIAPEMKRAKVTLNTVLVAQDGELAAWTVNAPEFLIDVPSVPRKQKAAKVEVTSTADEPATRSVIAAPPVRVQSGVIERPRPAVAPIIITKETVAKERRVFQAMTSTASNEIAPPVTNVAASIAPATSGNVRTNITTNVVAAVPPTNVIVPSAVVHVAPTNATKSNEAPATVVKVENTNAVAAIAPSSPALTKADAASSPSRVFHPLLWAAIGAGAALLVVLAIVLAMRSRRHEPSLISQAIAQQRTS